MAFSRSRDVISLTVLRLTVWLSTSRSKAATRSSAARSLPMKDTQYLRGSEMRQRTKLSIKRFFFSLVWTRSALGASSVRMRLSR